MATDLHQRPSTLLHVTDPLTAYCADRATLTFGRALEAAVRAATGKAKSEKAAEQAGLRVLERWLASADPADVKPARRFRDPFADPALRAQMGV